MERKTVNIYIDTSVKGPRRTAGAYGYVIESMTAAGAATFTNVKRQEETTEHKSLLTAILEAVGHLRMSCDICLYMDCTWMESAIMNWLPGWRDNGWKNKRDAEVADAELWKQLDACMNDHNITVQVNTDHEYWIYLEREVAAVAAGKAFTPL